MIKKQIVGVIFAGSIVAGVATGVIANAMVSEDPSAAATPRSSASSPSPSPSPSASATPSSEQTVPAGAESPAPDGFVISPGAVGDVTAGMSKAAALRTGLFDADVPPPVEGCPTTPLAWKKPYATTYDVYTVGNGEITSIGVLAKGPRTANGLGIGSTFDVVEKAVDDAEPVEAGYGQTGVFQYDAQTGGWIGYLFDEAPGDIGDDSVVTFIEVTKGAQPALMRDGC